MKTTFKKCNVGDWVYLYNGKLVSIVEKNEENPSFITISDGIVEQSRASAETVYPLSLRAKMISDLVMERISKLPVKYQNNSQGDTIGAEFGKIMNRDEAGTLTSNGYRLLIKELDQTLQKALITCKQYDEAEKRRLRENNN